LPSIDRVIRIAVPLACLQLLFAAVVLGSHGAPGALGGDFIAYYGAGKLMLAGDGQHLYELSAQLPYQQALLQHSGLTSGRPTMIPFDYPPPAVLLFLPFALVPATIAVWFWLALNGAGAIVSCRTLQRWRFSPLALTLLFPVDWGLLSGQPVGLMLLFAAISFRAFTAQEDAKGGAWLGLLAVFKPQLVLVPLLGLLVLRRPRALLGAAATGFALLLVSLVVVGIPGLVAYLGLLSKIDPALGNTTFSVRTGAMINWRAWITALPGIDGETALLLTASAAVATIGAALALSMRRHRHLDFAPLYLGLTAAGLVAGYHSHYQDLVILLPPVVAALPVLIGVLPHVWSQAPLHGNQRSKELRSHSVASALGDLALPGAALLLVVGPGLTWLLLGIFALNWLNVWTFLAVPGLLLLLIAIWHADASRLETASIVKGVAGVVTGDQTSNTFATFHAPIPASGER